jgi:lipopolysaccharide export system protein LptC
MPAVHDDAIPTGVEGGEGVGLVAPRPAKRLISAAPLHSREQAFAKASRRSARVRRLRLAIVIGGAGSIALTAAVAFFNPFVTNLGSLGIGTLAMDGTKIVMDKPKLAGFRSDGQPYLMTAERALQDVKRPTLVELQKVAGEIGRSGGEPTHLTADAGIYDNVSEQMQLSQNVRIRNGRFNVFLRSAKFDFKSGVYGSDEPVKVEAGDGTTIFADRAVALNHGQELTFEGHVRTNIVPQNGQQPVANGKQPVADVKGTNP